MLNDDKVALLARRFHAMDGATFSDVAISQALGQPVSGQDAELLSSKLGLEFAVFHAALMRQVGQMYPMRQMALGFPGPGPVQSFPMPGPGFRAAQGQLGQRQQPRDIINVMTALHKQSQLGNVTDEEVAAHHSEYIAALRVSSQIPSMLPPNGFP